MSKPQAATAPKTKAVENAGKSKREPQPQPAAGAAGEIISLHQRAGNRAVSRLIEGSYAPSGRQDRLQRQPDPTDQVKSSRRSIVIWEQDLGKRLKRIKLKHKLAVRAQIPKGTNETLEGILGATEAENVRKKASAIETELVAAEGDIFKLTPDGVQQWAQKHGVKASVKAEPVDVSLKTADVNEFKLPSVDLLKVSVKFEWFAGGAVLEYEFSGSASPLALLGAADRKLLEQFEKKVQSIRKETLELEKTSKQLDNAKLESRKANEALEQARKQQKEALEKLNKRPWDSYKKQSQELLDKSGKEISELHKKALDARSAELKLEHDIKTGKGPVDTKQLDNARMRTKKANEALGRARKRQDEGMKRLKRLHNEHLKATRKHSKELLKNSGKEIAELSKKALNAQTVERGLERSLETRKGTVRRLVGEASDIAKKGKSWVFKKVVGPRMLKVLGHVAKFLPVIGWISWAADIYEIGKLLFNWKKLKFGLGGGSGGGGNGGSGGQAGKSSTGKSGAKGGAGGGSGGTGGAGQGSSSAPPATSQQPQQQAPPGGTPADKAPAKPVPGGTDPTGQGTQGTGKGQGKTPAGGPSAPGSPGSQPGQGTDPAGVHDGPDSPAGGKEGTATGSGSGKVGGGKPGQGGGTDPKVKKGAGSKQDTGDQAGGKKKDRGGSKQPGGQGSKGKGDTAPGVKVKPPPVKAPSKGTVWARAVRIKSIGSKDELLFKEGTSLRIQKIAGISLWNSAIGKEGYVSVNVDYRDDQGNQTRYRVQGIPVRVVARPVEDLPKNVKGLQSYNLQIVMEVLKNLRLQGTRLVIQAGDELVYEWEGEY